MPYIKDDGHDHDFYYEAEVTWSPAADPVWTVVDLHFPETGAKDLTITKPTGMLAKIHKEMHDGTEFNLKVVSPDENLTSTLQQDSPTEKTLVLTVKGFEDDGSKYLVEDWITPNPSAKIYPLPSDCDADHLIMVDYNFARLSARLDQYVIHPSSREIEFFDNPETNDDIHLTYYPLKTKIPWTLFTDGKVPTERLYIRLAYGVDLRCTDDTEILFDPLTTGAILDNIEKITNTLYALSIHGQTVQAPGRVTLQKPGITFDPVSLETEIIPIGGVILYNAVDGQVQFPHHWGQGV